MVLPEFDGEAVPWTPTLEAGTKIVFSVSDRAGHFGYSQPLKLVAGTEYVTPHAQDFERLTFWRFSVSCLQNGLSLAYAEKLLALEAGSSGSQLRSLSLHSLPP